MSNVLGHQGHRVIYLSEKEGREDDFRSRDQLTLKLEEKIQHFQRKGKRVEEGVGSGARL